jgi:hypothetical protein
MALYPGARQRPISPGASDPRIIPIGVILHVDAGNQSSLYNYFNGPSGGIESHFHVPKSGSPEQYRDTAREADANYRGNSFERDGKTYGFISVETQGLASGEWNAHQLSEIKKLLLWCNKTHGIPLRRCPAWDQAGIGYHVMFGAPGPWTPVSKSCPGPDRIKQFTNVLVPWFKTATAPAPVPPGQKDLIDMATPAEVAQAVEDGIRNYMRDFFSNEQGTGDTLADAAAERGQATVAKLDELVAAVKELTEVLTPKA